MLVGERAIACVFDLSRHRRLAALACTTGIELGDTWSKLLVIYRISSCGIAWVVPPEFRRDRRVPRWASQA